MQGQGIVCAAEFGERYQRCLGDFHRMEFSLDSADPEIEEAPQRREIRRQVHLLPDEALYYMGMVRQMIKNLRRGEAGGQDWQRLGSHRRDLRMQAVTPKECTSLATSVPKIK